MKRGKRALTIRTNGSHTHPQLWHDCKCSAYINKHEHTARCGQSVSSVSHQAKSFQENMTLNSLLRMKHHMDVDKRSTQTLGGGAHRPGSADANKAARAGPAETRDWCDFIGC